MDAQLWGVICAIFIALSSGCGSRHVAPTHDADVHAAEDTQVGDLVPADGADQQLTLKERYCAAEISADLLAANAKNPLAVMHLKQAHYGSLVQAGITWERQGNVYLGMNLTNTGSDKEPAPLDEAAFFEKMDAYLMEAQLKGVFFLQEVWFNRPEKDYGPSKEFLRHFVERYDGDGVDDMPCLKAPITYYGMGNEVEDAYEGARDPSETVWKQAMDNYLAALKIYGDVIREANPNAKLVQAGMVKITGNKHWDYLFSKGALDYVDVFNFHEISSWETVAFTYTFLQELEQGHFAPRPVWITELQFERIETDQYASYQGETPEVYAARTVRYLLYAMAHGVEKIFLVNGSFDDLPPGATSNFSTASAVIANDQPTPVHAALKTMNDAIGGFSKVESLEEESFFDGSAVEGDPLSWVIRVESAKVKFTIGQRTVYALWGAGSISPLITGTVQVTPLFGTPSVVDASTVTLTGMPIFIEEVP